MILVIADVHRGAEEARVAVEVYRTDQLEAIQSMPRHDLPDSEVRLVTRLNQILRTLCVQYARCTLLTHAPRPLGSGTTPMSAIGSQLTQALGVQWAECLHGLFASGSVRAAFRPFYYLSIRLSAS